MDAAFTDRLRRIVGRRHALTEPDDLRLYQYDASIDRAMPEAVVLPANAREVADVVRACAERGYPFVARGAGTGLSGGAIAETGGVVISTARLDRIVEIDAENRLAVVEPGVPNAEITAAARPLGLQYIPDPSSMAVCTVGGNIAENSGGLHCLAYGVTANHVLGIEVVTPEGDLVWFGGKTVDVPSLDLLGLFVGSEGTLGIVTKAVLRLTPVPEDVRTLLAVYDSIENASRAVSDIIASGLIPAALEMMDQLATIAIEAHVHAGFPTDAAAILIVEVDGLRDAVDDLADAVRAVCERNNARYVRLAADDAERERIWRGRKAAFGAMGRFSPTYYVQDGVIPRTRLPEVLREVADIGRRHGLKIANVFHAGDGNLHPLIIFDATKPGDVERAVVAGDEILAACTSRGGSISGEHGIGTEKRDCMTLQFAPADLEFMARIRSVFNQRNLCNPLKMFPTARRCGEGARKLATGELSPQMARALGPAF
jgi:glycolate oxidase